MTHARLADAVGTDRTEVTKWLAGGLAPRPDAWAKLTAALGMNEAETRIFRSAAAWARAPEPVAQTLADEVGQLRAEVSRNQAEVVAWRERWANLLDAPEAQAAIDAQIAAALSIEGGKVNVCTATEARKLADAIPNGQAEVLEGLLALVATARARPDRGLGLAEALLAFRNLDDLAARESLLDAFALMTTGADRAAARYVVRTGEYEDQVRGIHSTSKESAAEAVLRIVGSAYFIPRVKMPEELILGSASTLVREELRARLIALGESMQRVAREAQRTGRNAWLPPLPDSSTARR